MRLTMTAPAKVNLCLKVLGKRPDGYHQLYTLMQPLSLGDELLIEDAGPGLGFSCSDPELAGEDNLVVRAARAWHRAAGREPALRLHLAKRVPVAAGLGGGSSDAAACLLGLNALYGRPLKAGELVGLAAGLGADVPFFLAGCTAICRGIGELVSPQPTFPLLSYVLVNPGLPVDTAWVYRQWDLAFTNAFDRTRISCPSNDRGALGGILVNDLEAVTTKTYPQLGEIKHRLLEVGAHGVLMSGSGPTVFGIFGDQVAADAAAQRLAAQGKWWVLACRGVLD